MKDCVFCQIISGKIPAERILEDDRILAILDINPLRPGHTLLLPKSHHETLIDLPEETLNQLTNKAQMIARGLLKAGETEGYNLFANNHKCSGQAIPHFHYHLVPRRTGDGIKFQWNTGTYGADEMKEWGTRIREALQK